MNKNKVKRKKMKRIPSLRIRLVFCILCSGLIGLSFRLFFLQVIQAKKLEKLARSFQIEKKAPLGSRRTIVDRNGKLLAFDEERFKIWAHPKYFSFPGDSFGFRRKPFEVASKLSDVVGLSNKKIIQIFNERSSGILLTDELEKEKANKIRQLYISGIDIEPYLKRTYPQQKLFANVVGFLDQQREPQAGVELSFNNQLLLNEKLKKFRLGADGTALPHDIDKGVFKNKRNDLILTLDSRLQNVAHNAVEKQVKAWKAKKGMAMVMNINDGEILALASYPTYDPNEYWKYPHVTFKEWSVEDLFEPGSTFKPINLLVALQEGVISKEGYIYDDGLINIGGWPLQNWDKGSNGKLSFAEVLQVSSNVGMVKIMSKLDPNKYWEWLHMLEISKTPNTDLPGAISGKLKDKTIFKKYPIEPAVASFGQGFSITPLKLAQLHAMIANGGILIQPHITKDFKTFLTKDSEDSPQERLFNEENTKIVLNWMESVVEKGSGIGVKTLGYRIGGKTGTAQKALNGLNYNARICSFVASLPIDNPKYVVLVVVDEPQSSNAYGSTVAVPVAKKIIDSLLVIEKIPPYRYPEVVKAKS